MLFIARVKDQKQRRGQVDKVHHGIRKKFNEQGNEKFRGSVKLCDRSSFRCFKMVQYTSLKDKTPLMVLEAANLHKVSVEHRFVNDLRWFIQDCC